ncbi:MAG: hypothetical protein R3B45_10205 [Bdellovibrionota bacterium]
MARNPKTYFRLISNITIAINLIVGVGAVYLVERIVPAIDEILQENAYSVQASMSMQVAIAEGNEAKFWESFEKAKSNITLNGEKEIVESVELHAKQLWSGAPEAKMKVIRKIGNLSSINLEAMDQKDKEARFLGLGGAWALGFLVIVSIALQLVARGRVLTRLMEPVSELISVLDDYQRGNRLRRFASSDATDEVKNGGVLLNKILDRDMTSKV